MGAVLAKFRKEKSSGEILEKLETDIRTIEKYSLSTQEKQRRLVGSFLVISIGLYAIGFFVIFFVFFPTTWPDRITYSVPLLAFPLIIFLVRRLLAWFFQRKINKNSTKLVKLRAEKKKILEEVMEKETYNVASKLLSKYGDKSYGIKALTVTAPTPHQNRPQTTENRIQNLNTSLAALSNRPGGPVQPFNNQMSINQSLLSAAANNRQPTISPPTPRSSSVTTHTGSALRYRGGPATPRSSALAVPNSRPYPIINQKAQGLLEKVVDYLIGDGPQNRYALICKECFAHNGMARQEDFDYATFRCAFCNELNPSRKLRPVAPRLASGMSPLHSRTISFSGRNSGSSTESSDDSDISHQAENTTSQQVAEVTEEKKEESEAENNNKHSNTNGVSVPKEEQIYQGDDVEMMVKAFKNLDAKFPIEKELDKIKSKNSNTNKASVPREEQINHGDDVEIIMQALRDHDPEFQKEHKMLKKTLDELLSEGSNTNQSSVPREEQFSHGDDVEMIKKALKDNDPEFQREDQMMRESIDMILNNDPNAHESSVPREEENAIKESETK